MLDEITARDFYNEAAFLCRETPGILFPARFPILGLALRL